MSGGDPLLYRELVEWASKVLNNGNVPDGDKLAEQIAFGFCEKKEGNYYRVPGLKAIKKVKRDRQIREEADQMTVAQLAARHKLRPATIYKIIGGTDEIHPV